MPSKHLSEKPGFFRKQLEHGAKNFRYRPGVRSLLGFSEAEDHLRFAQPLPPMDLRALTPHLSNTASSLQGFSLRNKNAHPHESASLQKTEKKRTQEKKNPEKNMSLNKTSKPTAPHRPSEPVFKKPEGLESEDHSLPVYKTEQTFSRLGNSFSDKKYRDDDALPHNFQEKIQVDIPGFSKNKSSFPALSPFTPEIIETRGDNKKQPSQQVQDLHRPSTQQNSILRKTESGKTLPARHVSEAVPSVLKTKAQIKQESAIALPPKENKVNADQKGQTAQTVAINLKDNQTINPSQRSQDLHRPSRQQNSILRKTESGEMRPTGHVSGDKGSRGRATPSVLHTETHRQQRPAIKYSSNEHHATRDEQKNDLEEREQALKTHMPQTAPIVIVKQTQPQNKTPSAFWERRYLSHAALKLRILR